MSRLALDVHCGGRRSVSALRPATPGAFAGDAGDYGLCWPKSSPAVVPQEQSGRRRRLAGTPRVSPRTPQAIQDLVFGDALRSRLCAALGRDDIFFLLCRRRQPPPLCSGGSAQPRLCLALGVRASAPNPKAHKPRQVPGRRWCGRAPRHRAGRYQCDRGQPKASPFHRGSAQASPPPLRPMLA